MPPLSERQCEPPGKKDKQWNKLHKISDAIEDAPKCWLSILDRGTPRPIREIRSGPADAIICTDGFAPQQDDAPGQEPQVGGVLLGWWRPASIWFGKTVPGDATKTWLPRENQSALVEIFAVVLGLAHFGPELAGKGIIILFDSECALDALIKGRSKVQDVVKLVKCFWDLVAEFLVDVYLDKVSTDAHPADGPSRGKKAEAKAFGCVEEHPRFPDELYVSRAKAWVIK